MSTLFQKHSALIDRTIQAIHERTFYTPYPEHHKAYGEENIEIGKKKFESLLGENFEEVGTNASDWIGEEESPFTRETLNIKYPAVSGDQLIENAANVRKSWKDAGPKTRAGILTESLERIKNRLFEIAFATMHTSGQSFMMAFQASGPHAMDRALEALVLGYQETTRFPSNVKWEKPMGKFNVVLDKTFTPVPKGIGLVIGCSTFPAWNSVPGLYASLVTGNPVIVKPHSKAVLPIAIYISEIRKVLKEEGFDPNICQMAPDTIATPITKQLAEHSAIKLIDYTGGTAFGNYIESLSGKTTFTEKAGVNSVIIDSVENLDKVLQNLAFSVSLFSGQMCTAPQNFFIPSTGVKEGDQMIPYDEVVQRFKAAVEGVINHPKMGAGTLATIQSDQTLQRVQNMEGVTILETNSIENPDFDEARTCTPVIMEVDASDTSTFGEELFGPIVLIVKTPDTNKSVELAAEMATTHGAITCAAYTTSLEMEEHIRNSMEDAFTPVSFNLTGFIWVNQAAAFSDFHVTGGNPAGNASFANPEYVNKRFVWVGHRKIAKN
jgi:phenylacetic acid degradation protein paaN